jgi:hypothetical protein
MKTVGFSAVFDGERVKFDESMALKPNTRLLVTILPDGGDVKGGKSKI